MGDWSSALQPERLASLFIELCRIPSPSRQEGPVAQVLRPLFAALGASIREDDSATATGSQTGNLVLSLPGTLPRPPVFFNAHMDTVGPTEGLAVVREGDRFRSAGNTVLGGDDKSGLAILAEVCRTLYDQRIPHRPFQLVFTTCEEIGLLGAKHLDFSLVSARMGYALDSSGVDQVVVGAPAANRLRFLVKGLAAHAGLCPEKGISAIQLAAQAIAGLRLGRLDDESTANIGRIAGGTATNIVPPEVVVEGEVRSHDLAKLEAFTRAMREAFSTAVAGWRDRSGQVAARPGLEIDEELEYPRLGAAADEPVVQEVTAAAARLGRQLSLIRAGGGSDANIFAGQGLATVILGTGMSKVHSTQEEILLPDMLRTAELVLAILTE
ncbi:MAG: M20/M25/M40 family metallo-hydrolase [Thermodesulfobacteriota bacterium]